MKISKQGNSIRYSITSALKTIDTTFRTSPTVETAVQRLALARTLHLLFNDQTQILHSQLLLAEQYLMLLSYQLSETYAMQVLEKDQNFNHRLRADLVLLKIKAELDSGDSVLTAIQKVKSKYQQTQQWTNDISLSVAKLEAKSYQKIKQYNSSITILKEAAETLKKAGKQNSKQYADLLLQNSHCLFLQKDYLKAVSKQREAIGIYEIYFPKQKIKLSEMYNGLSKLQEKCGAVQDEFKSLKKAEQLHVLGTSETDKSAVDLKKRIFYNLQKRGRDNQASKQLQQLKELINQKYGSFSLEMAETKHHLGKVYEKLQKKNQEYSEAANIYSEHKEKKQMQECRASMYRIKPHRLQIYRSVPAV